MDLSEKVLLGIRCCLPATDDDTELGCAQCPYNDERCGDADQDVMIRTVIIEDIRSLLKEQKPRLVTFDDFKSSPNLDEHGRLLVWQEVRPGSQVKTWSTWTTITPEYMSDLHNVRFWTRKPTKEQSEATPWT